MRVELIKKVANKITEILNFHKMSDTELLEISRITSNSLLHAVIKKAESNQEQLVEKKVAKKATKKKVAKKVSKKVAKKVAKKKVRRK